MNLSDRLQESFPRALPSCYWHFLMKNRHQAETYEIGKVQEKIGAISRSTGKPHSFQEKGEHGWTPAHVAVLAGNKAGLIFLRTMDASSVEQDDSGRRPEDYCLALNRFDLLAILQASNLELALLPLFEKWHAALPKAPFCYREHTSDFGVVIEELLFPGSRLNPTLGNRAVSFEHYVMNMKAIAEREGFAIIHTHEINFCRDVLFTLPNGEQVVSYVYRELDQSLDRTESLALLQQKRGFYATGHIYFAAQHGMSRHTADKTIDEYNRLVGIDPRRLNFFLEGGNVYLVTNANGKLKLVMGAAHWHTEVTHRLLTNYYEPYQVELQARAQGLFFKVSDEEVEQHFAEMHAQGHVPSRKVAQKGLLSIPEVQKVVNHFLRQPPGDDKSTACDIAEKLGYYQKPPKMNQEQLLQAKPLVVTYLAQKEMSRKFMAADFSMKEEDLHFIPEVRYHLDTFMRPGPKGSFFVQSFEMAHELLTTLLQNANKLGINDSDITILKRYLKTSEELGQQLKPLLEKTRDELKKGGFIVIDTPALFFDPSPSFQEHEDTRTVPCYNVNFINAISGWSKKNQQYYYITNGAQSGDKLGKILMEAFKAFLNSYVPGIQVYFTGYDPVNPDDYSQVWLWTSSFELQAGVHCFSKELKTASHIG